MSDETTDARLSGLTAELAKGRIDRRRFMEGALAMGLTVSAATTMWTKAASATPKKGGRFRAALDDGNTTDSMDPATYESMFQICMSHSHRNYLTEITPDNVVGPELAESWTASDDAAEWVFKLRKGVEFHNGKTFDAHDAVATLNYHRGEDSKSAGKALLDSVEEIKADDKYTLRVKLNGGSADFPYVLTDYHFTMQPSDGEGGIVWEDGVGTGGYVVEDFEPGVRCMMTRFPNYWKEGRAHFDEIEFLAIPDVNARQTGLSVRPETS